MHEISAILGHELLCFSTLHQGFGKFHDSECRWKGLLDQENYLQKTLLIFVISLFVSFLSSVLLKSGKIIAFLYLEYDMFINLIIYSFLKNCWMYVYVLPKFKICAIKFWPLKSKVKLSFPSKGPNHLLSLSIHKYNNPCYQKNLIVSIFELETSHIYKPYNFL